MDDDLGTKQNNDDDNGTGQAVQEEFFGAQVFGVGFFETDFRFALERVVGINGNRKLMICPIGQFVEVKVRIRHSSNRRRAQIPMISVASCWSFSAMPNFLP